MFTDEQLQNQVERITEEIQAHLHELNLDYEKLKTLLDEEHDAIRKYDMNVVEKCTHEKQVIGDRIELNVTGLKKISERIYQLEQNVFSEKTIRIKTLSQMLEALKKISLRKNFDKNFQNLDDAASKIFIAQKTLQPTLEIHRLVVTRMMDYVHESMNFWQKVLEESESQYTAKGISKKQNTKSLLAVKA